MFAVGDVVGSYTILAPLRSGGMADLFLARREGAAGFRRLVAVKVVHPRHAEDEQLVRMFLDEALISARIDHPNVVHVEDLGELDDTYFLVMEYVHGCSLAQLMRVLGKMHRRLSPLVAVAITARVAEGLHAAHETTDDSGTLVNLVHRDVSPQNILLSHKGHVKLIDFGVAKAEMRSEKTNVAMLKGKVRYMSPEQATTGLVDRRSDVYSLGIVLWEMLTMRRLFTGKTEFEVILEVRDPTIDPPSKHVPDLPVELDEVVLSALARDPDERPRTAKSFRRMLASALPRSMSLDSAHLADLMASVVGEQLEEVRQELPQEISRLLGAEQLRAALRDREERTDDTTQSVVDVMTVHSELVAFDEDELDDTPEVSAMFPVVKPAPRPEPERPADGPPSGPRSSEGGALSSDEGAAFGAPTDEDAEPTVVAGVMDHVVAPPRTHRDTDEVPTLPHGREPAPEIPLATLAAPPSLAAGASSAELRKMRPPPVWGWIAAVAASVLLGVILALLWPSGEDPPPAPARPAVAAPKDP